MPPGGLPPPSLLQGLWHAGTLPAQQALPSPPRWPREGGVRERRAPAALHASANVPPAAPIPAPSVSKDAAPPLPPPGPPSTQGVRRAEHGGVQGTGAPGIRYSRFVRVLFCKVKRAGVTGGKKTPVALCCPGLAAWRRAAAAAVNSRGVALGGFLQDNSSRSVLSNGAPKRGTPVASDSAGIKGGRASGGSVRRSPGSAPHPSPDGLGSIPPSYQWKLIKGRHCRLTEPCRVSSCQSLTFLIH